MDNRCDAVSNFSPDSWPRGSARFDTTQWTQVEAAGGDPGEQRDAAMAGFARAYWYPLYAFLRRRGESAENARDLVQEFFARLLEKNWLEGVERRETRFSTLLLTIFQRFLASEQRRALAVKRGARITFSIDLAEAEQWFVLEPSASKSPEEIFERRWAVAVLAAALGRLEDNCRAAGRGRLFEALSPYLSRQAGPGDYQTAAESLGITARSAAVAVHRLRRELGEAVRAEIRSGLIDPAGIDDEMRHLAAILARSWSSFPQVRTSATINDHPKQS